MTNRPGSDGFGPLEAQLRGALSREADAARPTDRLRDIQAAASPTRRRTGAWWAPIAAAAAVAAIVVGAWVGLRPGAAPPLISGIPSTTAPVSPAPNTAPFTSRTGSATPAPAAAVPVALPVYYLASPGSSDGRLGLVRVFVPGQLPADATVAQKADVALAAALTVPADNPNGFVAAWPAEVTAHYVELPAPEVGVSLSGPGVKGLTEQAQRLAVQALVWTVTAVVQQASAPVAVTVASGGPIFETVGTNVFKRPAAQQVFEEVAPIWVDSPYAGQAFAGGKDVVVTGLACVQEANVTWELRQGGSVVRQGHTMASSGCPQQGSWSVDLGTLAGGRYEFRATEISMKDGSVAFANVVPFTVG